MAAQGRRQQGAEKGQQNFEFSPSGFCSFINGFKTNHPPGKGSGKFDFLGMVGAVIGSFWKGLGPSSDLLERSNFAPPGILIMY